MGILIFHQHATNVAHHIIQGATRQVNSIPITSFTAAHKKKKGKKKKKEDKILNGSSDDFVLMETLPISYKRDLGKNCLNYKNWIQFEGYKLIFILLLIYFVIIQKYK